MRIWECDFCGKEFDTKIGCEKHEIFCKSRFEGKIDKIFVKKGNNFIGEGAILFFGSLGLIFLFEKSGVIVKSFVGFGGILMLIGFNMNLFGKEKVEFRCKGCGKRFLRKKKAIKHLKECKN